MQKKNIEVWIKRISKPNKKIGGHSICPFAKKAKYLLIENDLTKIKLSFPEDNDLVIFISNTDQAIPPKNLDKICKDLSIRYKEYIFLYNSKLEKTYINNQRTDNAMYDMIFCQPKEELNKAREVLGKTSYYDFWSKSFLNKILGKK